MNTVYISNSIFLHTEPLPPDGCCIRLVKGGEQHIYGIEIYTGIHHEPFWRRLKLSWRIFRTLMGYRPIRGAL